MLPLGFTFKKLAHGGVASVYMPTDST
ncbi:hypothetical protein RSAG8_13797, partial [Rhizoctonia solani AG-8 WAC10335]